MRRQIKAWEKAEVKINLQKSSRFFGFSYITAYSNVLIQRIYFIFWKVLNWMAIEAVLMIVAANKKVCKTLFFHFSQIPRGFVARIHCCFYIYVIKLNPDSNLGHFYICCSTINCKVLLNWPQGYWISPNIS